MSGKMPATWIDCVIRVGEICNICQDSERPVGNLIDLTNGISGSLAGESLVSVGASKTGHLVLASSHAKCVLESPSSRCFSI